MPRPPRVTGIDPYLGEDHYGRLSIPGAEVTISKSRIKRWTYGAHFRNRDKNGFNDPFTHFHLLKEVMHQRAGKPFNAAQLAQHMNYAVDEFEWDPITVGRIMGDWIESWQDANGRSPLITKRFFDGVHYTRTGDAESVAVMANLLDDLYALCMERREQQRQGGRRVYRNESPLVRCPSVTAILEEAV